MALTKQNLTNEFVKDSGLITVSILGKDNFEDIKQFGYQTVHKVDKFEGFTYGESTTNKLPVLLNATAYLDLKVDPDMIMEVGTHTLFICDVVGGEPITYSYYRANRGKA